MDFYIIIYKKSKIMNRKKIVLIILIILLAVVAFLSRSYLSRGLNFGDLSGSDEGSSYHAVFLNNDQVYFGKLSRQNSLYPVLEDVFYIQVNDEDNAAQLEGEATPDNRIRLIKLGGELHGPTDKMEINRESIVLVERLRENSELVAAINQYKEGQQ